MSNWYDEIEPKDRDKAKAAYGKAKTTEDKIAVLKTWHPKGYINIEPIKNLEEYFKYIRLTANDSTWFRGETMDHGFLVPKLYRNIAEENIAKQHEKERKYFYEFRRRARALAPHLDVNDIWSWYFLIQHYGGPTRLLDWTHDAAIALFFALDTDRDSLENPIVTELQATVLTTYALKSIKQEYSFSGTVLYPGETPTSLWINNISEARSGDTSIPDPPIALLPQYSDPRITAQRSCFTLFGKDIYGFYKESKHIVCPCCDQPVFSKLVIDGKKKNDLRRELVRIGVTTGKVYPGLDGLSKELAVEIFDGL